MEREEVINWGKKERNYQWRMPNVQTFLTGSPLKRFSVPKSLVAGPENF